MNYQPEILDLSRLFVLIRLARWIAIWWIMLHLGKLINKRMEDKQNGN